MSTRSKPPTRRAGQKGDGQKREMQKKTRKTTNAKDSHCRSKDHEVDDQKAIYVTVRCRGRSPQETEEDRAVILRTDGIEGKTVEVSMGSLANKTYNFDRVFSSAADQRVIYEDTVLPMVDEVRPAACRAM